MKLARLSLTALTALSSLASFAAYTLLLRHLGTTPQVDQYFYAASVPTGIAAFVTAVMLYLLPPRLAELPVAEQNGAIRYMLVALAVVTIVGMAGALCYGLLFGHSRLLWLVLGFIANAGLSLCGVLMVCRAQTAGSYVLVGLTQFVTVSGLFLGVALSVVLHDVWPTVVGQIAASAVAFTMAGLSLSFPFRSKFAQDRKRFRDFAWPLRRALFPVLLCMTAFTLFQPIDALLCSRLGDGALTIMAFAQRVWVAAATVISMGAHTIATKTSHDAFAVGGKAALCKLANREVLRILVTGAIAWALYATVGRALLAQVFSLSAIRPRDIETLLDSVSYMLMSASAMTAIPYLFRLLYTLKDYKGPAMIGCSIPVVYITCAWALLDRLGLFALPLALGIAWWLALLAAVARLNGYLGLPEHAHATQSPHGRPDEH